MKQLNLTFQVPVKQNDKKNDTQYPLLTRNTSSVFPFSKRRFSASAMTSPSSKVISSEIIIPTASPYTRNLRHATQYPDDIKPKPKMLWGKPTWYLLHTMAEKINESRFNEIRLEFLNIIYTICTNLPCPTCSEHAKQYLSKGAFLTIRTKDELKLLLFNFHNTVNSKKGYALFLVNDLEQYSKAIPVNIIENFMIEYNRKSKNIRLLADDMHRQNITSILKDWFKNNIMYFDAPVTPLPPVEN
jgi:hypothetical protein